MERVTVNLTDKAAEALHEAVQLSESNKTTVICKALHTYLLMIKTAAEEGDIYVRPAPGAPLERIIMI